MTINYSTLATVPLLEGLQPDDLSALAPNFESQTYEKGDTLFLKGDPGGALLIVISGTVELFVYDENQNRILLSQVTQGGFFGEITLFDSSERTANAIATETTHVLVLRQKVMVNFLLKHPDAALHVINVLSKRLRDTTDSLLTNKNRQAYDIFQEQQNVWERIADRASHVVGSWRYLLVLLCVVAIWVALNVAPILGVWDKPYEFNILNLLLTIIAAVQVPLILMTQQRQDDYSRISADLEYEVNLKAQLSILEVNRKLDWLRESMLDQTERLERLEREHEAELAGTTQP